MWVSVLAFSMRMVQVWSVFFLQLDYFLQVVLNIDYQTHVASSELYCNTIQTVGRAWGMGYGEFSGRGGFTCYYIMK